MASKHKQEDPWAGFVDVLSNILMVVIFLIVILGVAIFALSQQITKVAVENAVKAEREAQERQSEQAKADTVAEAKPPAAPPAQSSADPSRSEVAVAPEQETGTTGRFEAARNRRARESDETTGNTNLSVRSIRTPSKEVEIASEEQKPNDAPILVKSSSAFLTLKFGKGSFKIDKDASGAIQEFLGTVDDLKDKRIEIRAFAQSTVGSISEARRIAYYRAMQTRTELLRFGFVASNMEVKIRESELPEEVDVVRIFRKT
jgi:outer membrane protein OmpA-like peptidoglycan-associated protein